jgi:thiamine biosynthesis lipoprotein
VSAEAILGFDCFGGRCGVYVEGDADRAGEPTETAAQAAERARASLLLWHRAFTRFSAASELSLLNADPREVVGASPLMARLAATAREAGQLTGGLVDATLAEELAQAGYDGELPPALPLRLALALAPPRRPAGPSPARRWERLEGDEAARRVRRPPGLAVDSGGLAKGMFADELAATLGPHRSFAIDCAGDLAVGGAAGLARGIEVESPFDGTVLHRFSLAAGGVATSGIGRRSWLGADGRPAHHLLDPASGRPAFTGVVQATALAPSATLAEIHAKAAVLSGPDGGPGWLPWGGVLVLDDGSHLEVETPAAPAAEAVLPAS